MLKGDGNENDLISKKKKKKLQVQHTLFPISKKINLPVQHSFLQFLFRCFALLQCRFVWLKVMLHGTIRNDDF